MNIKLLSAYGHEQYRFPLITVNTFKSATVFCILIALAVNGSVVGQKQKYSDYCRSVNRSLGKCVQLQSCPLFFDWIHHRPIVKSNVKLVVQFTCFYDLVSPKVCCPLEEIDTTGNLNIIQDNTGFGNGPAVQVSVIPSPEKISSSSVVSETTSHDELHFPLDNTKDSNSLFPSRKSRSKENLKLRLLPGLTECSNSVKLNRLIGAYGSQPWVAVIGYKDKASGKFENLCAGTIINSRYILTSAHCQYEGKLQLTHIRVGDYNLDTDIDQGSAYLPPSTFKEYKIQKIIPHLNFDKEKRSNDIALIRVTQEIDFSSIFVKPVCLPFIKEFGISDLLKLDQLNNFISRKVLVAGWGKTTWNSTGSRVLQEAPVQFSSYEECENVYEDHFSLPLNKYYCIGGSLRQNSCTVDSGGPLLSPVSINTNRVPGFVEPKIFQLGIFSFGPTSEQCNQYQQEVSSKSISSRPQGHGGNLIPLPSIYTNVFAYLDWILNSIEA